MTTSRGWHVRYGASIQNSISGPEFDPLPVTQVTDHSPSFSSNTSQCNTEEDVVTLPRFAVRNTLRDKRSSLLTAISLVAAPGATAAVGEHCANIPSR